MTVSHEHFDEIATGAAADASVFNAPLLTLNAGIVAEEVTRAAEDDSLQANYEAADDALQANIDAEANDRYTADMQEAAARASADTNETATRTAADLILQAQIDAQDAGQASIGGTAFTLLTRNAGAAVIATIGSDGATMTVTTTGAHGFVDGDYVDITDCLTSAYNVSLGPIDVTAADAFNAPTVVPLTAEAHSGYARTKRLFVASTASFVATQLVTVTSDVGDLHTTTINAIPVSGQITLTAPVPTSWTLTSRASIGAVVSSTLEEVRLIRTAIGSDGTLTAAEAVKWAAGTFQNVRAFGAVGDGTTDDRATIQATIDAGAGSYTHKTILAPPGDYVFKSSAGSGRGAYTLLNSSDNLRIVGVPGTRFIMKNGAASRLFINRDADHVRVEGVEFVYDRADGASATAVQHENGSDAVYRDNTFTDWPFYGLAVTEDSSAFVYAASTVSFANATSRIADATNPFAAGASGVQVGDTITVVNSLYNDGIKHVTAVDGAHGHIEVSETLVDEAAGATAVKVVSSAISFSADGTLTSEDGGLDDLLFGGATLTISGSGSNDGTFDTENVDADGASLFAAAGTFVDEAAGAAVTITQTSKPSISVQRATACDDIVVTYNTFNGIGVIGYEDFPKVQSKNHTTAFNTFYYCGFATRNGCAMKPGQGVLNSQVVHNLVAHCVNGIQLGNWESEVVAHNLIENCYEFGIPMTKSNHQKYQASFASLLVYDNDVHYTKDYVSGADFDPSAANTIDPTEGVFSLRYGAINLNGLEDSQLGSAPDAGPIWIVKNRVTNWGLGLTMDKSLMPIPNVHWIGNEENGCGTSRVVPLVSRGTTTNGSPVIQNVYTGTAAGTTSWYPNTDLVGDATYFPAGTTVLSVDPAAMTITMSANAIAASSTATGVATTGAGFRSAYPEAMEWNENTFVETSPSASTKTVQVATTNGFVERNRLRGLGPYALAVKGDGTTILDNRGYKINQLGTASRSFILLNEHGTYRVAGNWLDVAALSGANAGGVAASIISGVIATGGAGLGGDISVALGNNNMATLQTCPVIEALSAMTIVPMYRTIDRWRTIAGTAAPVGGAWVQGERVEITNAGAAQPALLVASVSGAPGTWRPTAYLVTQYFGSTTWNPGSLLDGATTTVTVTATGAAVGDIVSVGFSSITTAGWSISGQVTSANTVTCVLTNHTGGTVDLPSGTIRVKAEQPY